MEEIIQIVGLGLLGTVLVMVVKQHKPELALLLSLAVGLIIFSFAVSRIIVIIRTLKDIANRIDVDRVYLNTILRVIGVAYIAEFGAQVCRDAGEEIIASKIELAGKVLIMIMGLPIMMAILEAVLQLLP